MAATSRASPTSGDRSDHRDSDGRGRSDSGMVTIEAAIALCAFISVLALVLAAMSMVFDQLRCIDAAREAARLVARGELDGAADVVHRIAPTDATYTVTTTGDGFVVAVRDPDSLLPGVDLHAEAYAVQEPTGDDEPTTAAPPGSTAVPQPGGSAGAEAVPGPSGASGPATAKPPGPSAVPEPGRPASTKPSGADSVPEPAADGRSHSGMAPEPDGNGPPAAGEPVRPSGPESGDGTRPAAHEPSGSVAVPGPGNGGKWPAEVPGRTGKDRQAADGLSRSTGGGGR